MPGRILTDAEVGLAPGGRVLTDADVGLAPPQAPVGQVASGQGAGAGVQLRTPVTAQGVTGQAGRGAVEGAVGIGNQLINAASNSPMGPLASASATTDNIAGLLQGAFGPSNQPPAPITNPAMVNGPQPVTPPKPVGDWLDQQPQNAAEWFGRAVGNFLPAAAIPESEAGLIPGMINRAKNVLLPAAGSVAGRAAVRAVGGNQEAQDIGAGFGSVIGGVGSQVSLRPGAPRPPIPQVGDAPESVARRAAQYVSSRAQAPNPTMEEAAAAGKPVTLAQRMGSAGQRALEATGKRPGATGDALQTYAYDPAEGVLPTQPARLQADFQQATGISPEAANGDMQAYVAAGRQRASPLYDRAYAQTPAVTPQLDALMRRPSMRDALGRAVSIAAEEGRDPNDLGFRSTASNGGYLVEVQAPSVQTLDYVKRGLDDVLNTYRDSTTGRLNLDERGLAIQATRNAFMRIVKDPNTVAGRAYGAALAESGDYLSAMDAFRKAKNLVFNPNVSADVIRSTVGRMTPAELGAFRGGVANEIYNRAQNLKLKPETFSTPNFQAKLSAVVGPEAAQRLIQAARQEGAIGGSLRRMAPSNGSPTAPLSAEMAAQDGMSPNLQRAAEFVSAPKKSMAQAVVRGLQGAADHFTGMTPEVRDAAGRLLMSRDITPEQIAAYQRQLRASKVPRLTMNLPQIPQYQPGGGRP